MDFKNQHVVVTGATGGLGKVLCKELLLNAATVTAVDYEDNSLKNMKTQFAKDGLQINIKTLDFSNLKNISNVIHEINQTKRIDIWFNNAGISKVGHFLETDLDTFSAVMKINYEAPLVVMKTLIPLMESAGHGSIVNIASMAGHVASAWLAPYVASKHALVGLTRTLYLDLKVSGSPVKLTLVSPGFFKTDMVKKSGSGKDFPAWLSFALSTPEIVVKQMLKGMRKDQPEITPTLNGKMMKLGSKLSPSYTSSSSKMLLHSNFKDWILGRTPK